MGQILRNKIRQERKPNKENRTEVKGDQSREGREEKSVARITKVMQ